MAEYNVVLKDAFGNDISTNLVDGMVAAKTRARYLLTDVYATNIGTTHIVLGTSKVEVQDVHSGDCLWDRFWTNAT